MKTNKLAEEGQEGENIETIEGPVVEDSQNVLQTNPDLTQTEMEEKNIVLKKPQQIVTIEVRFANGNVKQVKADIRNEKVADIKERLFKQELKEQMLCQLIYMGKMITDEIALSDLSNNQFRWVGRWYLHAWKSKSLRKIIRSRSKLQYRQKRLYKVLILLQTQVFRLKKLSQCVYIFMQIEFMKTTNSVYNKNRSDQKAIKELILEKQTFKFLNLCQVILDLYLKHNNKFKKCQLQLFVVVVYQVISFLFLLFSLQEFIQLCCLNLSDSKKRGIVCGLILSIGTILALLNIAFQ